MVLPNNVNLPIKFTESAVSKWSLSTILNLCKEYGEVIRTENEILINNVNFFIIIVIS